MVGEGRYSAKFTSGASSSAVRAELERDATGTDPEFTYELLIYVPSGQTFPGGDSLVQNKQAGSYNGGIEIVEAGATGGTIGLITVGATDQFRHFGLGTLPRDRWFAIKVAEKFSNSGYVQAWTDADGPGPAGYVQVVPRTSADTVAVDSSTKMRIGSYRAATDHPTTFYIDGYRMQCFYHC